MQIEGIKKVVVALKVVYKQPYPVAAKNDYYVSNRKVDMAVATERVDLLLDGVPYHGIHVYLLCKEE